MRAYRQKRCCWSKTGEAQGFGTGVRPVKDAAGSLVPGDEHAAGEEKDEDDEGGVCPDRCVRCQCDERKMACQEIGISCLCELYLLLLHLRLLLLAAERGCS